MRGFGLLLLPVVAKLASAQYQIDPESVPEATREIWCSNQQNACPLICLQTSANSSETVENECDPATLDFSCICENNLSPNASEYSQTIPYYVCTQWGTQCIAGCGGNTDCEYNCRAQHPCGAQNPTRVNVTTSSSATASQTGASSTNGGEATNSAGQTIYNGLGGSGAAATSSSSSQTGAATALQLGHAYGLFAVAAGIFGGFALLL
ncbi:hypothetical protein D6D13_06769 [Aureobasidium pullulans]|uniref:DUF7707 domain-containing protein n=1 Tax=Aureobasidium pullulans TaxID=5580 RepID=A0A4S9CG60_AURPU|nr:hypothetical protein D6D13_06769 [Aureobasidium pullulans]